MAPHTIAIPLLVLLIALLLMAQAIRAPHVKNSPVRRSLRRAARLDFLAILLACSAIVLLNQ